MTSPSFFQLNRTLRAFVIMLMAGVMLSFSSAETRAAVQVKLAEENGGIARFYEDKVTHHHVEVVRIAQMQTTREPQEVPTLSAAMHLTPPLAPVSRARRAASARAPPHCPRAPPAA
jgi:hypothetical protein